MNETVPFAAGFIKATIRVVILATECSKPDEKNANKHHQTIINFAVSSFDWNPDQTARQTKILHKIPRNINCKAGVDIFAAAALVKLPATNGKSKPEFINIQLNKAATPADYF